MEFSFLKKQTRAHKYFAYFSQAEINAVLDQYVPQLRSLQIFNSKIVPEEVQDEYHEKIEKIIQEVKEIFKNKLRSKIEKKTGDPLIAKIYASHPSGPRRSFPWANAVESSSTTSHAARHSGVSS